uniref:Uncharacterized protein n=1 Tax=Onchocerca volvulus TaxID=6282 RepID=A0A8R1TWV0_ONCVO
MVAYREVLEREKQVEGGNDCERFRSETRHEKDDIRGMQKMTQHDQREKARCMVLQSMRCSTTISSVKDSNTSVRNITDDDDDDDDR